VAAHKLTRKELKQDPFVEKSERVLNFIQNNATAVGAVLVVLVVLLVGWSYVRKGQEAAQVEASYLLYHGQTLLSQGAYELAMAPLMDCIEKHGKSDYAQYARVSLVQAMLGAGEAEDALARVEVYRDEVRANHPARADLDLLHAYALADAGRHLEAAEALAALSLEGLNDPAVYDRHVQRSRWLHAAGDHAAAHQVLTELHQLIKSGELELPTSDIETRLEAARALMR
jgi:predicted negative regulator of RcsB-dependent stress response